MRRIAATVLTLALSIHGSPLLAQEAPAEAPVVLMRPDAPAFHAGQWGAEFIWSGGVYGIGALKFTSPASAWVLDASVGAQFRDYADTESGYRAYGLGLAISKRRYRTPSGRVRPFTELGGQGYYNSARNESGANEATERQFGLGVHGGIGAQVFFARDMSIGAKWSADLSAARIQQYLNGTRVAESTAYYLDAGNVMIMGALYF